MRGTFTLDMQISAWAKRAFSGRGCKVNKQLAKYLKCNWVLLYAWDGPGCLLHKKASGRRGNQWQRLEHCRNVSPGTSRAPSEGQNPTAESKQLTVTLVSLDRKRSRLNQLYTPLASQKCLVLSVHFLNVLKTEEKLGRRRDPSRVQADQNALLPHTLVVSQNSVHWDFFLRY